MGKEGGRGKEKEELEVMLKESWKGGKRTKQNETRGMITGRRKEFRGYTRCFPVGRLPLEK